MNIVIVGAGEVGTHLAKMLSLEKHNIYLIDEDGDKLKNISNSYDLFTLKGSPTSFESFKEAGIEKADLFIAVTPHKSQNINACMIAKALGAKKTVARIDNYEYLQPKNKAIFEKMGVNALIYPEYLAAKEIVDMIGINWVRKYYEFSGGDLVMLGVKLRNDASIINRKMIELFSNEDRLYAVAIKRDQEMIIPRGDDEFRAGDIVFFITTKENIPYVKQFTGKENYDIKSLLIIGGSRISVKAVQFFPSSISVKIIESDIAKGEKLAEEVLDKAVIIHGNGTDFDFLTEEGISNVDAVAALTQNTETNILTCVAAKKFGVKKTIAEVENIDYIDLAENMDIGTVINKKLIAANYIYQMTLDADEESVKCLALFDAEVFEFEVKEDSKITRDIIRNVSLPKNVNIGGYVRANKGYLVNGNTQIEAGDRVVVFCHNMQDYKKVEKLFR